MPSGETKKSHVIDSQKKIVTVFVHHTSHLDFAPTFDRNNNISTHELSLCEGVESPCSIALLKDVNKGDYNSLCTLIIPQSFAPQITSSKPSPPVPIEDINTFFTFHHNTHRPHPHRYTALLSPRHAKLSRSPITPHPSAYFHKQSPTCTTEHASPLSTA